jgi:hypothetical protein
MTGLSMSSMAAAINRTPSAVDLFAGARARARAAKKSGAGGA